MQWPSDQTDDREIVGSTLTESNANTSDLVTYTPGGRAMTTGLTGVDYSVKAEILCLLYCTASQRMRADKDACCIMRCSRVPYILISQCEAFLGHD